MRFIGSKVNLLDNIQEVIEENVKDDAHVFMDLFSGTGIVGENFKKDYQVLSNDSLYFSYILLKAKIENNSIPNFSELKKIGIKEPLHYLENEEFEISHEFFLTHNYSPYMGCERMYFTVENASRIDFIRLTLNRWKNESLINELEFAYLLAILIEAVPFISNISGTYGAYLKHWDKRALGKLKLRTLDIGNNHYANKTYNEDANSLIEKVYGDILYIDPPYNGRQYISNYHLLETIALYDYPEIYGKTGLRPYVESKSLYCQKKEVGNAFNHLIEKANFRHILVSYSSEGLLLEEEIESILKSHGLPETYRIYKMPYRKYKSKHKQEASELHEYIFYIQKDIALTNSVKSNKKIEVGKHKTNSYIKSPLNYVGGKHKLLNQIVPLFPDKIDTFVDLFSGGFNVGINVNANKIIATDINTYVVEVLDTMKKTSVEEVIAHIERRIEEYGLSKSNEEGFKAFRNYYNKTKKPLDLYTLICYSFNYQFRFNNNQEYNNPFGRERSQFSPALKKKLVLFIEALHEKNVQFVCSEFEHFNFSQLDQNDLVYCDPPYLITTGSYNDGNRGFKDWNRLQEIKLLDILDHLNSKGVYFALSNVLSHKGLENELLLEWSKKYNIHHLQHSYSNSSHNTTRGESQEVLITNYTNYTK
uniref:Type II methyltransferase M.FokI n=1 Tax=Planomicrobium okeanokoites TaxID=244 RepID=MTF1_PLAOK|nr:RecName: Full=Type II methyltransferase M.FokI; Short=M.FokI; AltName: Full=Adenine-specific methyltransferase FokI; AltName: Full=Modification methylase FokI [Planomicrobium okeanokoites]AAA24926.1 methylase (MFokI) [Planomicrobium okeanokoites]